MTLTNLARARARPDIRSTPSFPGFTETAGSSQGLGDAYEPAPRSVTASRARSIDGSRPRKWPRRSSGLMDARKDHRAAPPPSTRAAPFG